MMQTFTRRRAAVLVAPAAIVLGLAGCGGSSSAGASNTSATASAAAQGRGGFGDNGQFQKIQECLTAAGISIPTPSGRPSGMAGARPTAMPSGAPGGNGGTPPSGAPGGGRGGFGGSVLQSSAAKAALKACGITLPTARPTAS